MYTTSYAKVRLNGDTHDEVMFGIGAKLGCPLPPHYSTGTLMNLEYIWTRSTEFLCVYLT